MTEHSPSSSYDEVRDGLAMPLVDAMTTQRAVRRLRPDPVDDEIVLRCIELALKAPTGSNSQNWEFVVVKEHDTKAALAEQYRRAWKLYGTAARTLTRSDDPAAAASRRSIAAVQWQIDHFEQIPVIVVPCLRGGRPPLLPAPPILAATYYGSIFPSVQNLLLAARALGLGASIITLPLWSTTLARRILGLPLSVQPICAVPLGWPHGRYGPTTRRAVGDVVHLDRYGHRPWPGRRIEDQPTRPASAGP